MDLLHAGVELSKLDVGADRWVKRFARRLPCKALFFVDELFHPLFPGFADALPELLGGFVLRIVAAAIEKATRARRKFSGGMKSSCFEPGEIVDLHGEGAVFLLFGFGVARECGIARQ